MAHSVHADSPTLDEYVPARQETQEIIPRPELYDPVEQRVQAEVEPSTENVPGAHG